MSADNYGYIAQNPDTEAWHIFQGCASDETDTLYSLETHLTEEDAFDAAMGDYWEYGFDSGPWPTDRIGR